MSDYRGALVETMILVSAADENITDSELTIITDIVGHLPVFRGYDSARLSQALETCVTLLGEEDGLDRGMTAIKDALPVKLRETAYALACDVVAADGEATQAELAILEMLRERLAIDRLIASALERGARARFAVA